jgi:hypothetical protein
MNHPDASEKSQPSNSIISELKTESDDFKPVVTGLDIIRSATIRHDNKNSGCKDDFKDENKVVPGIPNHICPMTNHNASEVKLDAVCKLWVEIFVQLME